MDLREFIEQRGRYFVIIYTTYAMIIALVMRIIGPEPIGAYFIELILLLLLGSGWILSLYIIIQSYNNKKIEDIEKTFDEIIRKVESINNKKIKEIEQLNNKKIKEVEDAFNRAAQKTESTSRKVESVLYDTYLERDFSWITTNHQLSEKYESQVGPGKAVVVVTPTFRNDYDQHDYSSGADFVDQVTANLVRGVKYRYITSKVVANKHFEGLIRYQKAKLAERTNKKLASDMIKVLVTGVPQIAEMVYYPLDKQAMAFTTVQTKANKAYKITEYNIQMVTEEDLDRFKGYISYLLNLQDVQIWEFDNDGCRQPRVFLEEDKKDFLLLTDLSPWEYKSS